MACWDLIEYRDQIPGLLLAANIAEDKLPYFASHSPFRSPYIFLMSTQFWLISNLSLSSYRTVICPTGLKSWQTTSISWVIEWSRQWNSGNWWFPEKLDPLGCTKQRRYLNPDTHRQNVLAKAPLPVTVKQIRSYLGGYQTDFRCKSEMSHFLTVLEEYTISKNHQKNWIALKI